MVSRKKPLHLSDHTFHRESNPGLLTPNARALAITPRERGIIYVLIILITYCTLTVLKRKYGLKCICSSNNCKPVWMHLSFLSSFNASRGIGCWPGQDMLTGAALLIIISYALLILQMFNYFNISFLVLYFYGQECTIIQKVSSRFREETKHETGQTYLFERVQYFEETIR